MTSPTEADSKKHSNLLSDTQLGILGAIADRIFPPTDTSGAVDIGAVEYIRIALAGDYVHFLPLYRRGLDAVSDEARAKWNRDFRQLSAEDQDSILSDFEAGAVAGYGEAAEFFETVRYHVLEGVFCEPQYGGNKDMMGWKIVEFPGQQAGYPDPYINKPVDLAPIAIDTQNEGNRRESTGNGRRR